LVALVKHLAVVVVDFRVGHLGGDLLGCVVKSLFIDVHQGHQPLAGRQSRVACAPPAAADDGDAQLGIGRSSGPDVGNTEQVRSSHGTTDGSTSLKKSTTADASLVTHGFTS